ncbi:protein-glutamate O-methyltransferase CheR [Treponema sp. C6A8]|uniref:CheR family methyltransferase n=1 Tax=Treponema sp. C6A8 TaxID=1410609 RepID=UPI0004821979|nr:CheR family methyltransferase [Treponema sp. C6A8]
MDESEFLSIIALITAQTGIVPRESHKIGIKNFIEKRLKEIDTQGLPYHSYLRLNKEEFDLLINAATVNETYFFREEAQFQLLKDKIFPELRAKLGTSPMRIWSAASSSGEEIYSLYLLAQSLNIKSECIASDINSSVLEKCRAGLYASSTTKKIDGAKFHYLLAPFQKADKSVSFPAAVSNKIERKQLNLSDQAAVFPKDLSLIFIRNVFIYFTMEMRRQILEKIVNESLNSGGYLFVSMSEIASIEKSIIPKELEKCSDGKVFYFRKK